MERLLLYLNRDTWISSRSCRHADVQEGREAVSGCEARRNMDGDTLAEVVRDARYAVGHTVVARVK